MPLLRRAELNYYAGESGALLPQSGTFHYAGPNGQHYRSFLRVGSAIQSPDSLDAVSFWLLPYVGPSTMVIVETTTISIIGMHLAQYLREEAYEDRAITAVHALPGYGRPALRQFIARTRATRPVIVDGASALVVISVSSTGVMAEIARSAAHDLGFTTTAAVALYGTPARATDAGTSDQTSALNDVFCFLESDLGRSPSNDCEMCDPKAPHSSPALPISPVTFTVGVAESVVPAKLDAVYATEAKEFVDRYRTTDAFSVHRDDPSDGRHHAVHIDVAKLLGHKDNIFKVRFLAKVDELAGQVDTILAPDHLTARSMAKLAGDRLKIPVVVRNPQDLGAATAEEIAHLNASRLLIIDDAIVSGDRLRSFRDELIEKGYDHEECHALVGVLRTQTDSETRGIANIVHQLGPTEKQLHAVEQVLLPNWQEDDCPWCWEQNLLHSRGKLGINSEQLANRETVLTSANGLREVLFWGWNDDQFRLGPNSVFGHKDLNQAQVFVVVSSALQSMRNRNVLDEQFTPPVSKVLTPEFWTHGRFYVNVVVASILRAARRHDLLAPTPGKAYLSAAESRLGKRKGTNLRMEVLLGMAAGKMPTAQMAAAVALEEADPAIGSLFNQLLGLSPKQ
ncbi:hypothetical protein D4739_15240 [Nocardioides cavernaquae]|uniref:Uncharacterized protein n=1 Tax=Nocardioides cavernaquae TaxID=2321396 RepID=A0A3A5H9X8_9ACTN|nr:hypothetical protein D4739_15240 [Nocardioides cavernaquae]